MNSFHPHITSVATATTETNCMTNLWGKRIPGLHRSGDRKQVSLTGSSQKEWLGREFRVGTDTGEMWSVLEFYGLYDLFLQWEYFLLQTVKENAINNRTRPLSLNWNCLKQIGTYGHLLKWKLSLRSRVNSSSSPENYLFMWQEEISSNWGRR